MPLKRLFNGRAKNYTRCYGSAKRASFALVTKVKRLGMKNLRLIFALLLLACLIAGSAWGQAVTASLVGTVTDASGAVIVNAKVVLTETNTGVSRTSSSNESGNYAFPNLPPGMYSVTIEQAGF